MAQWLPLYQLSPDDYRTAISSFVAAFDYVRLYYTGRDTVLLGSRSPWVDKKKTRPYLIASDETLRALVAGVEPNTEDRLTLEYTAPRSLYEKTEAANLAMLLELYELRGEGDNPPCVAVSYLMKGRLSYLEGDDAGAEAYYQRGLELIPWNEDLRQGLADVYFEWALAAWDAGDAERARDLFERILELTPAGEAARANLEMLGG
jgi:tetratricopeptide (TPR) repeat protein